MSSKTIPELSAAAALDGTELYESSQAGGSVKVTGDALRNGKVKTYISTLSQIGTNPPVETILENTLGGIPIYSYDSPGVYFMTLTGAFPNASKVITRCGGNTTYTTLVDVQDANTLRIRTSEGNDVFTDTPFTIHIYP